MLEKMIDLDAELIEGAARRLTADERYHEGQAVTREVLATAVETWLPILRDMLLAIRLVNAPTGRRRPRKFEEETWEALSEVEKEVAVSRSALLRAALSLTSEYGTDPEKLRASLLKLVKKSR
jgi:hypothetical protein